MARFFLLPIAFLVLLVLAIQGIDVLGGGELLTGLVPARGSRKVIRQPARRWLPWWR